MIKHPVWDNLSDGDRAKYGRIISRGFVLTLCVCLACTLYLVVRVWHWPFLLAYTVGPILGALLAFAVIFSPLWAILTVAAARRSP